MALGPVNVKETERILKLEERKQKTTNRITSSTSVFDREKSTLSTTLNRKGPSFEGVVKEDPSSVSSGTSSCSSLVLNGNVLKLPTLAKTCDQFGVSDRAAAAIASAVLQEENLTNLKSKQDLSVTKTDMVENINPINFNVAIIKVKNVRNGGLVISCENSEEMDKFKELANEKLASSYTIKEVPALNPRFKIVGMVECLSEEDILHLLKT
ncbi:unnamed protein product [Psylliodes chrysocephalus]|uniref:Uncharacterized protein n=1 Tax=Psylliodes chrysocephalus TaxID=3402493 RepID=A0A9P0CUA8_9CUCU|nr:unnamed protein product [Psylliodes chrysocephala]